MKYNNLMKKVKIFLLTFILVLFLINFKIVKIQGNSMYPTLKNNSYAIADRYLHKFFPIQKNDILLFEILDQEVVKKIVFFPGEKLYSGEEEIILASDEIYILGDNPAESIDSRNYGPINISQIKGKIVVSF
jgi:signal peptidase I